MPVAVAAAKVLDTRPVMVSAARLLLRGPDEGGRCESGRSVRPAPTPSRGKSDAAVDTAILSVIETGGTALCFGGRYGQLIRLRVSLPEASSISHAELAAPAHTSPRCTALRKFDVT